MLLWLTLHSSYWWYWSPRLIITISTPCLNKQHYKTAFRSKVLNVCGFTEELKDTDNRTFSDTICFKILNNSISFSFNMHGDLAINKKPILWKGINDTSLCDWLTDWHQVMPDTKFPSWQKAGYQGPSTWAQPTSHISAFSPENKMKIKPLLSFKGRFVRVNVYFQG